jgi:hypothetical protein
MRLPRLQLPPAKRTKRNARLRRVATILRNNGYRPESEEEEKKKATATTGGPHYGSARYCRARCSSAGRDFPATAPSN